MLSFPRAGQWSQGINLLPARDGSKDNSFPLNYLRDSWMGPETCLKSSGSQLPHEYYLLNHLAAVATLRRTSLTHFFDGIEPGKGYARF